MTTFRSEAPPSPLVITALGALAVAVTAASVWMSATSTVHDDPALVAGSRGLLLAAWLFAGLATWERRPGSPFGPLVMLAAFVWAITGLTALEAPALFSLGALVWPVSVVLIAAVILTFPDGRLGHLAARPVLVAIAAANAAVWAPLVLGGRTVPTLAGPLRCAEDCPGNPFRVLDLSPAAVDALQRGASAAAAATGIAVVGVLVAAWRSATPAWRHVLRPPALALLGLAATSALAGVLRGVLGEDDGLAVAAGWGPPITSSAFALSLLASQSRARLFAAGALRDLVGRLPPGTSHRELEVGMAEALGDPSLRLAFRVAPAGYVDLAGDPVDLSDPAVAVTEVRDGGTTVAAIVHDPVLEEPLAGVVEGAGAAVLLALDNARLEAEVRSSARELRESRARILAAGMSERRRLERDLHDTAQQRLVMLRVKLDLAEQRAEGDEELQRLLARLGADVEATIEGLREVARGLYPLFLEEQGLDAALRREVRASEVSPALTVRDIGRSRPDIESAVYVCCRDALSLLDREAGSEAVVELELDVRDAWLRIHFAGAAPSDDLAKRVAAQMRDPVATLGGRADASSSSGAGWGVTAYIPWPRRDGTPTSDVP